MYLLPLVLALLRPAVPPPARAAAPQAATAQGAVDPTVPEAAHALRSVLGRGVQRYVCLIKNDAPVWDLAGPEATLVDPRTGEHLGAHSAGPTWTWMDGSAILGNVLAKRPAADPANIPWLLLAAHPASGVPASATGNGGGFPAAVRYIRRSDTAGGAPPRTGCDAEHPGLRQDVPYSATYTFYVTGAAAEARP